MVEIGTCDAKVTVLRDRLHEMVLELVGTFFAEENLDEIAKDVIQTEHRSLKGKSKSAAGIKEQMSQLDREEDDIMKLLGMGATKKLQDRYSKLLLDRERLDTQLQELELAEEPMSLEEAKEAIRSVLGEGELVMTRVLPFIQSIKIIGQNKVKVALLVRTRTLKVQ